MSSAGGVLRVREPGRPGRDAVIGFSEACEFTRLGNYPVEKIRRALRGPAGMVLVGAGPDDMVVGVMVGHGDREAGCTSPPPSPAGEGGASGGSS